NTEFEEMINTAGDFLTTQEKSMNNINHTNENNAINKLSENEDISNTNAIRSLQDAATDQEQNDSINQSAKQRMTNLGTNTRVLQKNSEPELESEEESENEAIVNLISVKNPSKVK
ncbi:20418_t:CDS:2, partial [Dentiscutata erythropus]